MSNTVSVIIPVYNREAFVEECVASVLAQSYTDLEILLVDDGSTDNSRQICRQLTKADQRIKLIESDHLGVSGARNTALDKAIGEYVFFLDSDDVIHPMLLETLVNGIEKHNVAMAGTGVISVGENNWHKVAPKMQEIKTLGNIEYRTNTQAIHEFFRSATPINLIGGVMMRKSLIDTTRFDTEFFIGEDFYFIYQNLIKNADVVFLKQKWYYARWHETNVSHSVDYAAFKSRFMRRVRVWESEEALNRPHNARLQKYEAFGFYLKAVTKYNLDKESLRKVRALVKQYKKQMFSSFTILSKIKFTVCIHSSLFCKLFA